MTPENAKPLLRFSRDVGFLYARARTHWRAERYPQALQLLRLAQEQEPESPRLRLAGARVLSMLGAFDLSRREAIRLLAARQHIDEALFLAGANALAQGDADHARAFLMQYARRYPRGKHIDMAEDLLAQLDDAALHPAYGRRGKAIQRVFLAIQNGRLHYARQLVGHLSRRGSEDAVLLSLRALVLALGGESHKALRLAKRAYLLKSEHALPLCAMAVALTVQGLSPLAPQYLRRAAESAEDLSDSLFVVFIAGRLGMHALCHQMLLALSQKLPEHSEIHQLLILSAHNVGDVDLAAREVAKYAALDPADPVTVALGRYFAELQARRTPPPFSLPYRWTFPPGEGSFLSQLLPDIRENLTRAETLLSRDQGFTPLLRWGLHSPEVQDEDIRPLIHILSSLPCPASQGLLRELLLVSHRSTWLKNLAIAALFQTGDREVMWMSARGHLYTIQLVAPPSEKKERHHGIR